MGVPETFDTRLCDSLICESEILEKVVKMAKNAVRSEKAAPTSLKKCVRFEKRHPFL